MATDTKSKLALELWDSLQRAYDVMRKSQAKYTAEHNLTAPQFNVLEVLTKSGPVPLKRISEELLVTGANITCVVDNLEKENLVRRVPSKEDRRVIMAELTDEGKEKMNKIFPPFVKSMKEMAGVLTDTEQKELSNLLQKLNI